MIFSSIEFIIFFIFFLIVIKFLPNFQRNIIIISSLFFYAYWNPIFIFLIIYLCVATFYFIKKDSNLKISLSLIFLPLFYFKYSFFLFNLLPFSILEKISYQGNLPLAISFITFTAVAILVDIKTKKFTEIIDFKSFSEFLLYFPQLIAGPILRANQLIPTLKKKISFSNENIKFGLILFTIGFIKKIFFADNISIIIDPYFENPEIFTSKDLIKGYLLFPLQIYFDFSGYVDMALGISFILGIELPVNFNKPYLSYSLTDFWRRWHITLSNWFRDYLYFPLGGSKVKKLRIYLNLILTMSIAGLWHGASINFIIWGFLNGLFLSFEKMFDKKKSSSLFRIIINCFLIFNLWIIFRISEINLIYDYFFILYSNIPEIFVLENLLVFLFTVVLIFSQRYEDHIIIKRISSKVNLSILMPIFIIILITGLAISAGQSEKFIYFDF